MTNTKHGGKRKGAGRPATGKNETTVIRIDAALVPVISEIRAKYRKTKSLDNLINVTDNQDSISELEVEIVYLKGLRSDKELRKDNRELLLKIEKLEASALVDQDTINRLIAEKASNKPDRKPVKAGLEPHDYNGNGKEFKTKLVSILGGDNNVISAERKKAYAALNIAPKANGQLKSDADRFAVYEWLMVNKK